MSDFLVGDIVRIEEDEYPELVGLTGTITHFSIDKTSAWVETNPPFGVWCALYALSVVERA